MKIHPLAALAAVCIGGVTAALFVWPSCAQTGEAVATVLERKLDSKWNNATAVTPRIDAEQPTQFETATFAVG